MLWTLPKHCQLSVVWAVFYSIFKRPDTWGGKEEKKCLRPQTGQDSTFSLLFHTKILQFSPCLHFSLFANLLIVVSVSNLRVKKLMLEKGSQFWWIFTLTGDGGKFHVWKVGVHCSEQWFPLPAEFHTCSSWLQALLLKWRSIFEFLSPFVSW